MTIIDELIRQIDMERSLAEQFQKMALEIKEDIHLQDIFLNMAYNEEKQAKKLEEILSHFLEREVW